MLKFVNHPLRSLARALGLGVGLLCAAAGSVVAAPVMHVHDSAGNLGTVDVVSGAVNTLGNMGVVMTDIAFDPTGKLYGISFNGLYTINPLTAMSTLVGSHGIAEGNALVFGSDGTLYGAGANTTTLFRINPNTGAATSLGGTGYFSGGDLAFKDGSLYLASSNNQLVRVDLANPAGSAAVGSFGVSNVFGLATGDNNLLYAVANTMLYTVDVSSGQTSAPVSFAFQGLGQAFGQSFYTEAGAPVGGGTPGAGNAVPEPSSWALAAAALAGLACMRRRCGA